MSSWARRLAHSLVVIAAALAVLGCTSSEPEEPGRVVGKSSYTRPPWVNKPMVVTSSRRLGYMSHTKRGVSVLELGIKQAQVEAGTQALARFNQAFADYVVDLVRTKGDRPDVKKAEREAWYGSVRQAALEAAGRFEAPVLKSDTVYWEEVELMVPSDAGGQELAREYRIYVRLSFEMTEFTDRLALLAGRLASGTGGRYDVALAAIDAEFPGIRAVAEESAADKKDVEAIQTEMDSAGADIDSSLDRKGPRGRKLTPKGGAGAAPVNSGADAPKK